MDSHPSIPASQHPTIHPTIIAWKDSSALSMICPKARWKSVTRVALSPPETALSASSSRESRLSCESLRHGGHRAAQKERDLLWMGNIFMGYNDYGNIHFFFDIFNGLKRQYPFWICLMGYNGNIMGYFKDIGCFWNIQSTISLVVTTVTITTGWWLSHPSEKNELMMTFPTEWKVIQNSMVPVTTNQDYNGNIMGIQLEI